ncbi:tyrosine-type recombinase/integrase [Lysinibacillus sp. FSL W8-0992]|uniref:tyrosine-type recombinase/integrase n=1 Tax=Lysinibacillus sp. FSL W8-0992 TaxID=2954643 RepID=UPI0030FC5EB9
MTKKKGIFDVTIAADVLKPKEVALEPKGMTTEKALENIARQMELNGYRERTLKDYKLIFNQFVEATGIKYVEEINVNTIYTWLENMNVGDSTKLTRLKCLKAVLGKCHNNGWLPNKFWLNIQIKVDKKVKKGATSNDLNVLLSLLDTTTFIGLRDAVAILTMYKTGVRIKTLGLIESKYIDFTDKSLILPGSIMKNHNLLKLPLDEQLLRMYKILIMQNNLIRSHYEVENDFLFITKKGESINGKSTNNAISKQLNKYSKRYDLPNINAHSIRRAYAKNLYEKGVPIPIISKALGHSDLAVTTQYLDIDVEEVVDALRNYL